MANPLVFFDNNSNLLTVSGVENELTGSLISNATVQATLKDANRVNLVRAAGTWPETLSNYASGAYRGVIAGTVSYPAGEEGYCLLQITGDGYSAEFELPCVYAVRRKASSQ